MLQQSTLMGLLDPNTTNSSRYIVVHDSHIVMLIGRVTCHIWRGPGLPSKVTPQFCILITSDIKLDLHTNYFRR